MLPFIYIRENVYSILLTNGMGGRGVEGGGRGGGPFNHVNGKPDVDFISFDNFILNISYARTHMYFLSDNC